MAVDSMDEARKRNEDRKISEAALKLDELNAKRNRIVGAHLKALEAEQTEDAQMLNLVVQKAIEFHGLLNVEKHPDFIVSCERLAYALTARRRTREQTQLKEMLVLAKPPELPNEVLVATAKRAGVELLEQLSPLVKG